MIEKGSEGSLTLYAKWTKEISPSAKAASLDYVKGTKDVYKRQVANDVSRENEKDGMIMKNYSEDVNRQYHIQVAKDEVGRYVILPGEMCIRDRHCIMLLQPH